MKEYAQEMPWEAPDSYGKHRQNLAPSGNVQWPLKIMRISPVAPFFHKAHLLMAADCSAFSYARFSEVFIKGRTLIIALNGFDILGMCQANINAGFFKSIENRNPVFARRFHAHVTTIKGREPTRQPPQISFEG